MDERPGTGGTDDVESSLHAEGWLGGDGRLVSAKPASSTGTGGHVGKTGRLEQECDSAVDGGWSQSYRHVGSQAGSTTRESRPVCHDFYGDSGVRICEYLPKQAAMLDKFTILRSVNARGSSHQPNQVFQTGNVLAAPRTNRKGHLYPAIGSIVGKHRGANDPSLPPYVVLNLRDKTHFAWGGYLGRQHDPFVGDRVGKRLQLPTGLDIDRVQDRRTLSAAMDQLHREVDQSGSIEALNAFEQKAFDMVSGTKAREAFDVSREPQAIRDRYGKHEWAQKALLARRLVEAGVSYVTVDFSNHRSSGRGILTVTTFLHGGIWNGLRPLLPVFDHLITTLVADLDQRGMLDDVLVIAMGEFGRTPELGTQGSTDGRNHWPRVMSMCMAGGGFRHGQVIGSTEPDGGEIKERPVTPGDLAATIYRHMGVPLDGTYLDTQGRPNPIVENGRPIEELI